MGLTDRFWILLGFLALGNQAQGKEDIGAVFGIAMIVYCIISIIFYIFKKEV